MARFIKHITTVLYIFFWPTAIVLMGTAEPDQNKQFRAGVALAFCSVILRIDSTRADIKDKESI